jgi:hypothetical protein
VHDNLEDDGLVLGQSLVLFQVSKKAMHQSVYDANLHDFPVQQAKVVMVNKSTNFQG